MKLVILLFLTLLFNIDSAYGCKCSLRYIVEELELSNEILVGEIINDENSKYGIRIIKEWSKIHTVRENNITYIEQQNSSCTRRTFELNETYLFYIQKGEIHNCSRTIEFSKTQDIQWLDQDISLQTTYYNSSTEYDEINYNRNYVITDNNGIKYDTKDKNVIYVFKNKLISKSEVPEDRNWFYPIRYYKIEEGIEVENIDLIFFVDFSHQDRIGEPRLSRRILRKIRKARRKQTVSQHRLSPTLDATETLSKP